MATDTSKAIKKKATKMSEDEMTKMANNLSKLRYDTPNPGTPSIVKIVIKSESGYVPVTLAYKDKLTITSNSISYEYNPLLESSETIKWSYKTSSDAFQKCFYKVHYQALLLLEKQDTDIVLDAGAMSVELYFDDKSKKKVSAATVSRIFEDFLREAKPLVPVNEYFPESLKSDSYYHQEEYREQIHYLMDRLEAQFKENKYELSQPWTMFIPTYIRGICNTIEEQKAISAQDLYDLTRIFSVMSTCPTEEVKNVMLAMSEMIMSSCDQENKKPDYSYLSEEDKEWLNKI